MQLKESFQKTKKFFHKTLKDLKSLLFGGYQKLPKPINLFSCGSRNMRNCSTDQYYIDFCNEWECDLEKTMKWKNRGAVMVPKEQVREEEDASKEPSVKTANSPLQKKNEDGGKEEKNRKGSHAKRGSEEKSSKNMKEAGYALAQKMKELDMMDVSDVEHVLDVEEAIHYYSRLKSPAYLDIVDKFFVDMYTEFSVPQASVSISNSKRRLGSIRL